MKQLSKQLYSCLNRVHRLGSALGKVVGIWLPYPSSSSIPCFSFSHSLTLSHSHTPGLLVWSPSDLGHPLVAASWSAAQALPHGFSTFSQHSDIWYSTDPSVNMSLAQLKFAFKHEIWNHRCSRYFYKSHWEAKAEEPFLGSLRPRLISSCYLMNIKQNLVRVTQICFLNLGE